MWQCREQRFSYVQNYVSQIHALFIDLDVGRSPEESKNEFDQMTADEALEGALVLMEESAIPMPTLTVASGRGCYLLYLLTEPLDATPGNVGRWRVVVDSFLDRIVHLAPDIGACHTLNRCFKAPGSGGSVVYSMLDDGSGDLRRYSFDEIDAFLLNHPYSAEAVEPEVERACYEPLACTIRKRRSAVKRSWLQNARSMIVRRNELHRLNEFRAGRWPEMRHKLMLYYATAQRRIAYEFFRNDPAATDTVKAIALRKTLRFNAKLADPLPREEVAGIFDTMPYKPHRNETIVSELHITKKDMLACGLTSLIPNDVRQRKENEKVSKKNAKYSAAMWLDYFVMNGMPVMCISKLMGKDRISIRRYIRKVEEKMRGEGSILPTRASLRGHATLK